MAKARSPQYPAIGLKEAVDKIAAVYAKDYQNKTTRDVVAKHMGYDSLHGKALGVLSALGKYGLLEGRGNENSVSNLAMAIIAHPVGSPERVAALKEAAAKPELFAELDGRFNGGKGSDSAIRSYLLTQKFIPGAADLVIRSYRETKQLVETESGGYSGDDGKPEAPMQSEKQDFSNLGPKPPHPMRSKLDDPNPPAAGVRKAVFALAEGDVTLTFPEGLSAESVEDLEGYIEIFLRKVRRDASKSAGSNDEAAN